MSGSATSGSWSAGSSPPDIIDLDRFMRGAVRPSRPDTCAPLREQLVVDAGGAERKVCRSEHKTGPTPKRSVLNNKRGGVAARCTASDAVHESKHTKQYSHDSGVSDDDSDNESRHRPPRRGRGSGTSLRVWRSECARTLKQQQSQLERVAALCERMSERCRHRYDSSSDVSSTSRDTHSCRGYKIIMSKLDELNRIVARGVKMAPPAAPARPASSGSVSVSDKVVSTEPAGVVSHVANMSRTSRAINGRHIAKRVQVLTMQEQVNLRAERSGVLNCGGVGGGSRCARAVEQVCTLDIAPSDALPPRAAPAPSPRPPPRPAPDPSPRPPPRPAHTPQPGAADCVIEYNNQAYVPDPRQPFDLDDPVRLYAQAKQMQVLSMRRSPPTESSEQAAGWGSDEDAGEAGAAAGRAGGGRRPRDKPAPSAPSWCTLCRLYLRSLTSFCYPSACH